MDGSISSTIEAEFASAQYSHMTVTTTEVEKGNDEFMGSLNSIFSEGIDNTFGSSSTSSNEMLSMTSDIEEMKNSMKSSLTTSAGESENEMSSTEMVRDLVEFGGSQHVVYAVVLRVGTNVNQLVRGQ